MTKQYKGRTATIEIDEKNVIIKSSGFFSSSKKTIPLRVHKIHVQPDSL